MILNEEFTYTGKTPYTWNFNQKPDTMTVIPFIHFYATNTNFNILSGCPPFAKCIIIYFLSVKEYIFLVSYNIVHFL